MSISGMWRARSIRRPQLCGAEVEKGEWLRCRSCRLDYGIAQHQRERLIDDNPGLFP